MIVSILAFMTILYGVISFLSDGCYFYGDKLFIIFLGFALIIAERLGEESLSKINKTRVKK